jgi:acetoin utilization protein AcuB
MLAEQLIVEEIPTLRITDTGDTALRWMDEFKVTNLCVANGTVFLGTISEDIVLDMTDLGAEVATCKDSFNHAFVRSNQHIFEALKAVNEHTLSVIPVLDKKEKYLGCINDTKLMSVIADLPMANAPGSVITVELNNHDYSLQAISGIIEENNARILGTYVTSSSDSTKLLLTIKLNTTEVGAIISSLQRFDYEITYYENDEKDDDSIQDRFDAFMSYLNV